MCLAYLAGTCTFGSRCFNRHPGAAECEKVKAEYKQRKCLYGDGCRSEGCLFSHPREAITVDSEVLEMAAQLRLEETQSSASAPPQPTPQSVPPPIHFPPASSLPPPPAQSPTFIPYDSWLSSGCPVPSNSHWMSSSGQQVRSFMRVCVREERTETSSESSTMCLRILTPSIISCSSLLSSLSSLVAADPGGSLRQP